VVRSPQQLRLHRALEEVGWTGAMDEFARLTEPFTPDPILITDSRRLWALAVGDFRRKAEINCIEYRLSEDESLQFILTHHQTRCGWNDFVRIRLALTLEPNLQQKALDNMSNGGKFKGLANLPEARHIDVTKRGCPRGKGWRP